ncbi:MAG: AIM24 family protein [Haloarculaceae archaeon]
MELEDFVSSNAPGEGRERFELENSKLLDIDVDGSVMTKAGSMIAYDGNLSFTGKASAEGGVMGFIKESVTSEGTPIMEVEGQGHVYVADQGKKVQPLSLDAGESITVNGNDVLAFETSVDYSIGTIGSVGGAQAGGLTNVFLEGPGMVAITTHGDPMVLAPPVKTDPDATVAWSSNLSPGISSNRSISDSIGQSSGETYQMSFDGQQGFVVVQPYEERPAGQNQ